MLRFPLTPIAVRVTWAITLDAESRVEVTSHCLYNSLLHTAPPTHSQLQQNTAQQTKLMLKLCNSQSGHPCSVTRSAHTLSCCIYMKACLMQVWWLLLAHIHTCQGMGHTCKVGNRKGGVGSQVPWRAKVKGKGWAETRASRGGRAGEVGNWWQVQEPMTLVQEADLPHSLCQGIQGESSPSADAQGDRDGIIWIGDLCNGSIL